MIVLLAVFGYVGQSNWEEVELLFQDEDPSKVHEHRAKVIGELTESYFRDYGSNVSVINNGYFVTVRAVNTDGVYAKLYVKGLE
jgi:hypothetical protein